MTASAATRLRVGTVVLAWMQVEACDVFIFVVVPVLAFVSPLELRCIVERISPQSAFIAADAWATCRRLDIPSRADVLFFMP